MTTRPAPVNRQSASKPSGPPLKAHTSALISSSASLTGHHPITLGSHAILQLRSHLLSAGGPIDIGEGCIISERASIGLSTTSLPDVKADNEASAGVRLAQGVLIDPGATVEAASLGAFTIVEAGAKIGRGVVIGRNCKICAQVEVADGDTVGDNVVIFGNGCGQRRVEKRGGVMEGKRGAWVGELGGALRRAWSGK